MHANVKKYAIGFAIFLVYYLVATRLVNSVSILKSLSGASTSNS